MLAPCVNALQITDKFSKTFTVLQDLVSVGVRRHERFRGVGNIKQTETMLAVSQNQISLPPVTYQVYPGDTNGGVIGPAVLAPPKVQWQATRADTTKIFGPGLGGKPAAKKPRTDDTVEPVFSHSMPVTF